MDRFSKRPPKKGGFTKSSSSSSSSSSVKGSSPVAHSGSDSLVGRKMHAAVDSAENKRGNRGRTYGKSGYNDYRDKLGGSSNGKLNKSVSEDYSPKSSHPPMYNKHPNNTGGRISMDSTGHSRPEAVTSSESGGNIPGSHPKSSSDVVDSKVSPSREMGVKESVVPPRDVAVKDSVVPPRSYGMVAKGIAPGKDSQPQNARQEPAVVVDNPGKVPYDGVAEPVPHYEPRPARSGHAHRSGKSGKGYNHHGYKNHPVPEDRLNVVDRPVQMPRRFEMGPDVQGAYDPSFYNHDRVPRTDVKFERHSGVSSVVDGRYIGYSYPKHRHSPRYNHVMGDTSPFSIPSSVEGVNGHFENDVREEDYNRGPMNMGVAMPPYSGNMAGPGIPMQGVMPGMPPVSMGPYVGPRWGPSPPAPPAPPFVVPPTSVSPVAAGGMFIPPTSSVSRPPTFPARKSSAFQIRNPETGEVLNTDAKAPTIARPKMPIPGPRNIPLPPMVDGSVLPPPPPPPVQRGPLPPMEESGSVGPMPVPLMVPPMGMPHPVPLPLGQVGPGMGVPPNVQGVGAMYPQSYAQGGGAPGFAPMAPMMYTQSPPSSVTPDRCEDEDGVTEQLPSMVSAPPQDDSVKASAIPVNAPIVPPEPEGRTGRHRVQNKAVEVNDQTVDLSVRHPMCDTVARSAVRGRISSRRVDNTDFGIPPKAGTPEPTPEVPDDDSSKPLDTVDVEQVVDEAVEPSEELATPETKETNDIDLEPGESRDVVRAPFDGYRLATETLVILPDESDDESEDSPDKKSPRSPRVLPDPGILSPMDLQGICYSETFKNKPIPSDFIPIYHRDVVLGYAFVSSLHLRKTFLGFKLVPATCNLETSSSRESRSKSYGHGSYSQQSSFSGSSSSGQRNKLFERSKSDQKWRREAKPEQPRVSPFKRGEISREEQFKRTVRGLLNKLTVEKFLTVAENLAVLYEKLTHEEDVDAMADLIIDKSVSELDYSDVYADLAYLISCRFNDNFDVGSKNTLFYRVLLNKLQDSFDALSNVTMTASLLASDNGASVDKPDKALEGEVDTEKDAEKDTEKDAEKDTEKDTENGAEKDTETPAVNIPRNRTKKWVLGNIRFMGELFLRKVISVGILKRIVCTLLQMDSDGSHIPCEYLVESFLELITTIGYTLEQMPHGPDMLNDYMGHLTNLKKNGNYSLRIVYKIQDLIDLRAKNWVKKVFKERATSVADIHLEAKQEELKGGSIHLNQEGKFTTAGRQARRHYSDYLMNQRQLALSKMVNGVYVAQDKSPDEPAPEPSTAPETSVSCDPVSPVLESSSSSEFPKSALKSDPNKKHPGGVRFADKEPRSPADDVMDVFKHDPPHDRFTVEWNQLQMSHSDCLEALSKMIDKCLNAVSVSKAEIRGDLIAYTIGRLLPSSRCKIEAFSIFETTCLVRLQDEVLDNPGAVSLFARILYKVLDYFYKQPDISLERINLPPEFDLARDLAVRVLDSMKDSEDSLHYARGLLVSSFACFEDHDLSFLDA